jgi:hypothetical protein
MLSLASFVLTHGSFVGNSGAAIVSTGARKVLAVRRGGAARSRAQPMEPTISN